MARPATTRITSPYGYSDGYDGFHKGIDFAHIDPNDTPVFAYRAGTVTHVGWISGWAGLGMVVAIDHGGGVQSWSCHLAAASVSVGQKVTEGQRIATMGNSATKYVHLHWVIVKDGVMVDPTPYLSATAGTATTPSAPEEDDDMKLTRIIFDKPNPGESAAAMKKRPEYASTAIISTITGFIQTSAGGGDRGALEAWTNIANALGMPVTEVHVDANGWQLAQLFQPVPSSATIVAGIIAGLKRLLPTLELSVDDADIAAIAKAVAAAMPNPATEFSVKAVK